MHHNTVQKFNIVSELVIKELISDYYSRNIYDTSTMNKVEPGKSLEIILSVLEDCLGRKLEYVTGNFYKHNSPYLPHTDFKTYQGNTINVVIPLEYSGVQPSLIIFDQTWELDSVTWCMHYPVQYFTYNIGVKGCPYEYPVKNLTDKPIDVDFYKEFLSQYPEYCLYGLSGLAFTFQPGSIIIFDNRKIHCTSSMSGTKLGLSLRFK